MNSQKLSLKDLVTLGIFVLIYFVMMFIIGTPLGFMVVTYTLYPLVYAIVSGIITMFFMAKVQKKWAIFLFFFIPTVVMVLMGHTFVVLVHTLIFAMIAELIHQKRGLQSISGNIITHLIGSLWLVGPFWQIYIMADRYYELTESLISKEYADELLSLPFWIMPALYLSVLIGGYLGGKLGAKVLKKHFERAGLT